MKKILYILCVYYRMSKVAHNLSRYLKLSVDMLHVICFQEILLSVRDILHMQLGYLKHFFGIHYRTEEGRVHKD